MLAGVLVAAAGVVAIASEKLSPADVVVEAPVYEVNEPMAAAHERWEYSFSWTGIPVGDVAIANRIVQEGESRHLAIEVEGRTNSFIDLFWAYRLRAEGEVKMDPLAPSRFRAEESEKGRRKLTSIEFGKDRMVRAVRQKGDRVSEFEFRAPNTHDMLSSTFLALNLDYQQGETYEFDTLTGSSRYLVSVTAEGVEPVEAGGSVQDGLRLKVLTKALTDPEDNGKHRESHLWVSASKPRRLLIVRSKTFIGAVTGTLQAVHGVQAASVPRKVASVLPVDPVR